MIFGINSIAYKAVAAAGVRLGAWRAYNPPPSGVPAAWPGGKAGTPPPGAVPVVSFRPAIADVLAGKLDGPLDAWFAKVPENAWVAAWAEGEGGRFGHSPEEIRGLAEYLYPRFTAAAPLTARFGQIFESWTAGPKGRGLSQFVVPDMDFYGVDTYADPANGLTTPAAVLGPVVSQILAAAPGSEPLICVTECNTADVEAQPEWFSLAYRLARDTAAQLFMPYFGTGVGATPFDPANADVVAVLREIGQDTA
jgi:hypothetical protein